MEKLGLNNQERKFSSPTNELVDKIQFQSLESIENKEIIEDFESQEKKENQEREKKTKTFFITGATGFVGSHLAAEFLKEGHKLIILARKDSDRSAEQKVYESLKPFFDNLDEYDEYFKNNVKVAEGDVSDNNLGLTENSFSNISEIDEIVHLAASLSFREKDRDKTMHTNVDGTANVLEFAKSKGAKKVNFISTAYVCGKKEGLITEDFIPESEKPKFNNPYEESKYIAEQKIKNWSSENKISVNIFRPGIIVGKGDTDSSFGYYGVAKVFALMRREIILNDERQNFPVILMLDLIL